MRHRATRPAVGLLLRLPGAAARRLGLAAGRPARTRALGLLVAVLAVGGVGFAVVASVVGGGAGQPAPSSVSPEPPATPEPGGSAQQEPATTVSPSGTPRPTRRPEGPSASTASPPADPSSTSEASPSTAGASDRLPSTATRTATPSPRAAASTAEDDAPPETTVSHDVTGPGAALLTFSADETATFTCSLDGAAYVPCASAESYSELDPGWHTFTVRATDAAGNVDTSPAGTRWLSTPGGAEPSGGR